MYKTIVPIPIVSEYYLNVWWHISATRYEISIMIILENYRDTTNFPGNSIEDSEMFHDKNIAIFLTLITFFLRSYPQVTFTISIIRYGFGSSLPSCTAKNFRVHPNGNFSIYRYLESASTITMILPRCQFRARMRNN